MELCDGDLHPVMRAKLDHERISYIVYQLICGLKHMHHVGIVHRDLKPQNIMARTNCTVKIADFGLSRFIENAPGNRFTPYVVTRWYRAPEVILGWDNQERIDIWSLGCIFAEFFRGMPLFPGNDQIQQWELIVKALGLPTEDFLSTLEMPVRRFVCRNIEPAVGLNSILKPIYFPPDSDDCPNLTQENAKDLISKMLVIDPRKRITLDEALKHPYISGWFRDDDIIQRPTSNVGAHEEMCEDTKTTEHWRKLTFDELMQIRATKD